MFDEIKKEIEELKKKLAETKKAKKTVKKSKSKESTTTKNVKVNKPKKQKLTPEEKKMRRLQNKLTRTLSHMGLSWSAWSSVIEIADTIGEKIPNPTACWVYNDKSKQEKIYISTKLIKSLPVKILALVIKHEMLHKAYYRQIKGASNKALVNLALDCSINKILALSEARSAIKLGQYLFPEKDAEGSVNEERTGFCALLNPSILDKERSLMSRGVREIFDDIYVGKYGHYNRDTGEKTTKEIACANLILAKKYNRFINETVPDPVAIYHRLSALLSEKEKKQVEKGYENYLKANADAKSNGGNHIHGGDKNRRATDKKTIQREREAADAVLENIRRGGGHSAYLDLDAQFRKFVYSTKESETDDVEAFAQRMETMKQVDGTIHNIYAQISHKTSVDPYAHNLTRTGLELVALGISTPEFPIFFNDNRDQTGKKKVVCYFDTSPSMNDFVPYMVYIAKFFAECEECEMAGGEYRGRYAFSETVKGMDDDQWKEFVKGHVRGGCGTSFDGVVSHLLNRVNEDEVDIALVFTDGYSSVSEDKVEEFNNTGKKCYTIYFTNPDTYYGYGHQRKGQETGIEMTSDLDLLNGESFTIRCHPVEEDK